MLSEFAIDKRLSTRGRAFSLSIPLSTTSTRPPRSFYRLAQMRSQVSVVSQPALPMPMPPTPALTASCFCTHRRSAAPLQFGCGARPQKIWMLDASCIQTCTVFHDWCQSAAGSPTRPGSFETAPLFLLPCGRRHTRAAGAGWLRGEVARRWRACGR